MCVCVWILKQIDWIAHISGIISQNTAAGRTVTLSGELELASDLYLEIVLRHTRLVMVGSVPVK